jgi:hypothetical protein
MKNEIRPLVQLVVIITMGSIIKFSNDYSFPSLRAYFGTGFERGIHRGYPFIEGLRYTSLVVSANQGLYSRRSDKIIWTLRLVIQNYCSPTYESNNLLVKYSPFNSISSLKRRHIGICQYYPILPPFY